MDAFPFSVESLGVSTQQVLPIILLLITGLVLMVLDAFKVKASLAWIAGTGMAASGVLAWLQAVPESQIVFFGMMETGGIAPIVHLFLCMSGIFTLPFLADYMKRQEKVVNDVYALLVFSVLGMVLMANANDLMMTFIGLETMSMALYIFAALFKTEVGSNEAGLKYFLLGSFASAFLLFGISLIYGIAGYTNLDMLATAESMARLQMNEPIFYLAAGLVLVGFLFKIAAFPFHNWTPDVYEGSPTPLAGFMATGSKLATFVALGVIMQKVHFADFGKTITIVAFAALLTMIYGNIVAARQSNLKRMLAYSSIAHSGYALLGLCAATVGFKAILFYMFIYTLMNIGAFGMVGMVENKTEDTDMEAWRGLGKKAPYFAGALSVFLFSLAGIPPLAGFMSKYQVFISAIREDLVFLATVGILTSVIGAFYYIRVMVLMFFNSQDQEPSFNLNFPLWPKVGVVVLVALIIILGVFPGLVLGPIDHAFGAEAHSHAAALIGK
ncbi:MAG: NADH-quinone oxidoreductase subunit N [Bacteroidota bacterium]